MQLTMSQTRSSASPSSITLQPVRLELPPPLVAAITIGVAAGAGVIVGAGEEFATAVAVSIGSGVASGPGDNPRFATVALVKAEPPPDDSFPVDPTAESAPLPLDPTAAAGAAAPASMIDSFVGGLLPTNGVWSVATSLLAPATNGALVGAAGSIVATRGANAVSLGASMAADCSRFAE